VSTITGSRLLGAWGIAFLVLLYLPIGLILVYSFNANVVNMMAWEGFTLDWYRSLLGLPTSLGRSANYVQSTATLLAAVRNSLLVAAVATLLSTVIGTCSALALTRHRFRLRPLYQALLVMPMVMPDIVLGIAHCPSTVWQPSSTVFGTVGLSRRACHAAARPDAARGPRSRWRTCPRGSTPGRGTCNWQRS
jgi:ABC-type spermidine/putrescine transport system permease subunit II